MDTDLKNIAGWLRDARRAVVFTGAGISTESGIPDFRSPGGIWSRTQPVYFADFLRSAQSRQEYWRQKAASHDVLWNARPNIAHRTLARWESSGTLRGVITQNIDGLHQAAGSRHVLELHGTAREIACLDCGARFAAEAWVRLFQERDEVPDCPNCAGVLKHATVSFGQTLPPEVMDEAARWAGECDLFLAIGSSLVVTPAADLPVLAARSGARLAIINREPTPLDGLAGAVIRGEIGATLQGLESLIRD
jgi:NAD-dependent deacetylase